MDDTEQTNEWEENIGKIKYKQYVYDESSSRVIPEEVNNTELIQTNKRNETTPETSQTLEKLEKEPIDKINTKESIYVEPTSTTSTSIPEVIKVRIDISESGETNKQNKTQPETSQSLEELEKETVVPNIETRSVEIELKLSKRKKIESDNTQTLKKLKIEIKKGNKRNKKKLTIEPPSGSALKETKKLLNKRKKIDSQTSQTLRKETKKSNKKKKEELTNVKSTSEIIELSNEIEETEKGAKRKKKELTYVKPPSKSKQKQIETLVLTSNEINENGLEPSQASEKNTRSKRKRKDFTDIESPLGPSKEEVEGRLSDYDKIDLFKGLIQHGSSDIPLLHTFVPNKSEDNIKRFVYSNKRVARYALSEGKDKAPIDKWLDFLQGEPERDTEKLYDLSRTLKYIALFEPCANESESMLSDCYKLLSDCMRGDSPKHLNPVTSLFLHGQINNLIKIWKTEDYSREHKHLEGYKKKKSCYAGKKKITTDNITEIDPSISNPLKIPDSLLELKK